MHLSPRMHGGGMVELLVALVLLSLGLLGMVAAHASALRWTKLGEHRQTALWLAQDLVERARANRGRLTPSDVVAQAYVFTLDAQAQVPAVAMPPELCNSAQSACSLTQMAQADLAQWRAAVRERLPAGMVWVTRTADTLDLAVAWQEPGGDELGASTCPAAWRLGGPWRCVTWQAVL